MTPARAWPAALIGLALAGGCGGGERVRAERGQIEIELREYRLIPQRIQTHAGRLRVVVRNRGVLDHRLAIGRGRFALARAAAVAPRRDTTLTVRLPRGRYRMFCTLSNHDTLGMYGSVVVP